MLKQEQLAWLKRALDETAPGDEGGLLLGKTYAEMVEIFRQQTGANLSAEGLRYHVRKLGRKNLSPGRRPYRPQEHRWVGQIGHLLLAITRWSPNRLYQLMRINTRSLYPPVSSVSFYKLLTAIKPVPSRLFDHPPGHLIERYKLRLHQVCMVDAHDEPIGMWLVGFEAYTGFCHAQWLEFRYPRQYAKRGRPRKIPAVEDAPIAYLQPKMQILLPDDLITEFCRKCLSRSFLPLSQFLLPHGYGVAGLTERLNFCAKAPIVTVDRLPGSVFKIPATWDSKTIENLRRRVLRWINRHNRLLVQEAIADEWSAIAPKLTRSGRGPKKTDWGRDKRRIRWEDDVALKTFYYYHPHFPGQLSPISDRVKLLRLEKKPDESGNAA